MKKNSLKRDLKKIPFVFIVLILLSLCIGQPLRRNIDAIVVWQHFDEEKNEWDAWYSIWDDTNGFWWTPKDTAAPISEMEGDDWDPNIEFGPPDSAIAVWSNQKTQDIYFSKWDSNTWTWSKEKVIDEVEGLDIDPDVAYNFYGKAIAVWVHIENGKRIIYYSYYDGYNWSKAKPLTDDYKLEKASLPEISFEGENRGTAIVVWCEDDEIYYSRFDGKNWSSPAPIPQQPEIALGDFKNYTELRLGISEYGSVKATWQSEKNVYYSLWTGSYWTQPQVVGEKEMPETDNDSGDRAMIVYINKEDMWSSYEGENFFSKFAADSGDLDFRPAVTFLYNDKALATWWSKEIKPSEIYYSLWTGNWSKAKSVVPDGLKGEDKNPEISSPWKKPPSTPTPTITEEPKPPPQYCDPVALGCECLTDKDAQQKALNTNTKAVKCDPNPCDPAKFGKDKYCYKFIETPEQPPPIEEKPLLTGISSTFCEEEDGVIEICVTLLGGYPNLEYIVYDLEILFNEQEPKWKNATVLQPLPGWTSEKIDGGIRFYGDKPLPIDEKICFKIKVEGDVGENIFIHVTYKNRKNMGYFVSQKIPCEKPPSEKSIITPISSKFKVVEDNIVEVEIVVGEYIPGTNRIYDLEIFPEVQEPPWKGVDVVELPEGWMWERIGNGVRLYSENHIPIGEPFKFKIKINAEKIPTSITIHATDKNHENMGLIISQYVAEKKLPDIVIPSIIVSSQPVAVPTPSPIYTGDSATIYVEVTNQGEAEATDFIVSLQILEYVQTSVPITLKPGQSITLTFSYIFGAPGYYQIMAMADSTYIVEESNEENNTKVITLTVNPKPLPDLVVSYIKVYWSYQTVGEVTKMYLNQVDFTVTNFGMGETTEPIEVHVFLDSPSNVWGTYTYSNPLGKGQSFSYSFIFTYQNEISYGQHVIGVTVDPQNKIQEANEENNTTQKEFPSQYNVSILLAVDSLNPKKTIQNIYLI